MIGETLTESLVHLLQGEQVPVENLNGNKNIISLFNRILANQGIESVSRTIHEKALKDDVIRSALVEAESIIKNRQAENAEPADDLETFPPLPVKMNFFPQSFPLKDVYMQYSKRISPEGYEDFHSTCFWVLLSTIAARRIAVNLAQRIYTAIMVTLVARTTLITKTTTTNALRNVLHALDLDWLLGARKPTPSKLISITPSSPPGNERPTSLDLSRVRQACSSYAKTRQLPI